MARVFVNIPILRSELSLSRLGTVSPAQSTPDLEAMRRPGKHRFEATKKAVDNFGQEEVTKKLSNFESARMTSNSDIESVRRPSNAPALSDMNNGWKSREDDRRNRKEDERSNMKEDEGEIGVESLTLDERPPSAETVAEDYSLPSYHQVGATTNHV